MRVYLRDRIASDRIEDCPAVARRCQDVVIRPRRRGGYGSAVIPPVVHDHRCIRAGQGNGGVDVDVLPRVEGKPCGCPCGGNGGVDVDIVRGVQGKGGIGGPAYSIIDVDVPVRAAA